MEVTTRMELDGVGGSVRLYAKRGVRLGFRPLQQRTR